MTAVLEKQAEGGRLDEIMAALKGAGSSAMEMGSTALAKGKELGSAALEKGKELASQVPFDPASAAVGGGTAAILAGSHAMGDKDSSTMKKILEVVGAGGLGAAAGGVAGGASKGLAKDLLAYLNKKPATVPDEPAPDLDIHGGNNQDVQMPDATVGDNKPAPDLLLGGKDLPFDRKEQGGY
jgi:hypothetical protein